MAKMYFKKLNTANVIADRAGSPIEWESLGDRDRTGVRALDTEIDANLIADLDKYADDRVGGVIRISPEIYEELKKKEEPPRKSSAQLSGLRLAAQPEPYSRPSVEAAPSAAAVESASFQEPPPPSASTFFARTRRAQAQKPTE